MWVLMHFHEATIWVNITNALKTSLNQQYYQYHEFVPYLYSNKIKASVKHRVIDFINITSKTTTVHVGTYNLMETSI